MSCNARNCQNLAGLTATPMTTSTYEDTQEVLTLPLVGQVHRTLLDGKMLEAFGASLLHSDGGDMSHVWYRRWIKVAHLKCQHYDLPGGATGREFVSQLSEEVSRLARGECRSERLIVYLAVMMQKDALVKKAADIRRLLK